LSPPLQANENVEIAITATNEYDLKLFLSILSSQI
jgi:hypothetical protein